MNAIITGATKGIGRATAERFAAEGWNLAICARSENDLQLTRAALLQLAPQPVEIITFAADVQKKAEVIAFASHVLQRWQQVDVLVNNAGVFLPGDIHKEEEGILETLIETNLYSAYHLTRALLPAMLPFRKGHIFNLCSVASLLAYPNGGSYSISKFALLGFSKVLREELKDKGIKVTAVMPGATWSHSWQGVDLPESRLMQADDIAKAIWGATQLSPAAVIEEIIIRPQLGDL